MVRTAVLASALICFSHGAMGVGTSVVTAQAGAAQTTSGSAGTITPAQAAPFLGDWAITVPEGAFGLAVKTDKQTVVAELTSDALPTGPISSVSLVEKSLKLDYVFDYQNMSVNAVLWLTPAENGNLTTRFDFASGAYEMLGTATKKPLK